MDTQLTTGKEREFRVKSATPPPELGSAIAHAIRDGDHVVLKAVGAGAVNQAVKAIPIAQSFVISYGIDLIQKINFFNGESPEGEIRGIAIHVLPLKEYQSSAAHA